MEFLEEAKWDPLSLPNTSKLGKYTQSQVVRSSSVTNFSKYFSEPYRLQKC